MPGPFRHHRALAGLHRSDHVLGRPRYRSETIFGLPSTRAISRKYQYGRPLIVFLYKLATL
jgi:hypothetical protein